MPKKPAHGRSKQSKNRARRAAARPITPSTAPAIDESSVPAPTNGAVSGFAATATSVTTPARPVRPSGQAPSRRGGSAGRRSPVITINYEYLRRDLRLLGVLAPAMIVLLLIAFFVIR